MGVSSEIAKIKTMTHYLNHTKTQANLCKTQNSSYVLHLGGNDWIRRKPKPRRLYEMTFARGTFFPPLGFPLFYTAGTCAHAQTWSLDRVGGLRLLGYLWCGNHWLYMTIRITARCEKGAQVPRTRGRCKNVGKWEPGACRRPERHKATPETIRGQQSHRGAGRSVGRWRERKSCGSPGSRRGYGVQMSGWLAHMLPPTDLPG